LFRSGAADDGAELAIDLGHLVAVKALAVQDGDLALGAVDRVVDQVELDLELFALLDLGAIGFEQRACLCGLALDQNVRRGCRAAGHCHLRPDRTQLGHDLAMHRTCIGVRDVRHLEVAADGFFNTKTLAMYGHETIPALQLLHLLYVCDLTRGSREELPTSHDDGVPHYPRLTMGFARSSKINATGEIRAQHATW